MPRQTSFPHMLAYRLLYVDQEDSPSILTPSRPERFATLWDTRYHTILLWISVLALESQSNPPGHRSILRSARGHFSPPHPNMLGVISMTNGHTNATVSGAVITQQCACLQGSVRAKHDRNGSGLTKTPCELAALRHGKARTIQHLDPVRIGERLVRGSRSTGRPRGLRVTASRVVSEHVWPNDDFNRSTSAQ